MFLYDKTNILEGSGIFEVDFAPSHGPAVMYVSQNRLFIVFVVLYPLQDLFGGDVCGEKCEGDGGGEAGDRGQEEEHALVAEQGGEVLGEEGSQGASSSRAGHHQPVVLGAVPRAVTLGVANNVICYSFQISDYLY